MIDDMNDDRKRRASVVINALIKDYTEHPDHWCRGVVPNAGDKYCIINGLSKLSLRGFDADANRLVLDAVYKRTPDRIGGVPTWNDQCAQNVEDVIALLKEAVAL